MKRQKCGAEVPVLFFAAGFFMGLFIRFLPFIIIFLIVFLIFSLFCKVR
ncbi:MAG: hypothetical protein IJ945_09330 [Oscillospiraceae bacterium]|nr:hypothetical protein [Oscillospiraceae bacterium]